MTTTAYEPSVSDPEEETPTEEVRVYAVGARKGGTGKTRLAMLIALMLAVVFGKRVAYFDADSASQTSSNWPPKARARKYAWPFEVIRHPFETLDKEIDKVIERGGVDYIIIDVGGGNIEAFMAAVRRSRKLIVPLCPDEGDLEQAPATREAALMAASRNTVGGCLMYYVLMRCENSGDKDEAREILLDEDSGDEDGPYPLLDTDIPMLVAYKRSFGRIPQMRKPADDPKCPRWKDLVGFVPLLMETEILTVSEILDKALMTRREVAEMTPMLLREEILTEQEVLDLGIMTKRELDALLEREMA